MRSTERLLIIGLLTAGAIIPSVLSIRLRETSTIPALRPTPPDYRVIVVSRHGQYQPEGRDLDGDKHQDFVGQTPLELTQRGRELMQKLGRLLVARYGDHFHQMIMEQKKLDIEKATAPRTWNYRETPDLIQVTAINTGIAKASAEEIINEIKRQKTEFATDMKIALSKNNIEWNEYFDPLKLRENTCKGFAKKASSLKIPEKLKVEAKGRFKDKNYEEVFRQYERLQMEMLAGLDPPDWTLPTDDQGREDMKVMKKAAVERMKRLIGNNPSYWTYFVSRMMRTILTEFGIPLPGDFRQPVSPRLHIHVVDDHLLAALAWWLRLEKSMEQFFGPGGFEYYPQVGDSIVIEIDNENLAKVFYLRLVEESASEEGFQRLSLKGKEEDWPVLYQKDYRGEVSAARFYSELFTEWQWIQTCLDGKDFTKSKYKRFFILAMLFPCFGKQ